MNFASFSEELVQKRSRHAGGMIALEQVDSTHLLGRRIVEEYTREGSTVPDTDIVAWCQSAAQGRRSGRIWSSPPGCGVYATLIRSRCREQPDQDWLQTLPLYTAVALAVCLNRYLDGHCRLKWPNDLLVGDKKLGGILIDAVLQGEEIMVATVSFGINHGDDLAGIGEARATSVLTEMASAASGVLSPPGLSTLSLELIASLDQELAASSHSDILDHYQQLSSHRPGEVLRCQIGDEPLEGTFRGFDEHGFLRLETGGRERLLSTGEILGGG